MNPLTKRILIVTIMIAALGWPLASAYATYISPKRVMIEDKRRATVITLLNSGNQTMVYRFEWEHRAFTPDGESRLLEEGETSPGYRPADPYLQFSPRQVILKPKEHQKIRVLVRRPPEMEEGEYHSHLLFLSDPLVEKPKENVPGQGGVQASLAIRAYSSIPVFLRHGETNIDIKLHSPAIFKNDGANFVKFKIENNSTRSVYAQSVLDCKMANGEVVSRPHVTTRIYTEMKTMDREFRVKDDFPIDQCQSLTMRLMGTDDFEYRKKEITRLELR